MKKIYFLTFLVPLLLFSFITHTMKQQQDIEKNMQHDIEKNNFEKVLKFFNALTRKITISPDSLKHLVEAIDNQEALNLLTAIMKSNDKITPLCNFNCNTTPYYKPNDIDNLIELAITKKNYCAATAILNINKKNIQGSQIIIDKKILELLINDSSDKALKLIENLKESTIVDKNTQKQIQSIEKSKQKLTTNQSTLIQKAIKQSKFKESLKLFNASKNKINVSYDLLIIFIDKNDDKNEDAFKLLTEIMQSDSKIEPIYYINIVALIEHAIKNKKYRIADAIFKIKPSNAYKTKPNNITKQETFIKIKLQLLEKLIDVSNDAKAFELLTTIMQSKDKINKIANWIIYYTIKYAIENEKYPAAKAILNINPANIKDNKKIIISKELLKNLIDKSDDKKEALDLLKVIMEFDKENKPFHKIYNTTINSVMSHAIENKKYPAANAILNINKKNIQGSLTIIIDKKILELLINDSSDKALKLIEKIKKSTVIDPKTKQAIGKIEQSKQKSKNKDHKKEITEKTPTKEALQRTLTNLAKALNALKTQNTI